MLLAIRPWRTRLPLSLRIRFKRSYTVLPSPKHDLPTVKHRDTVEVAYTATLPKDGNTTDGALVIIHGLFGSKRNWFSLSKAFHRATSRPVYALDMRNHGASPRAVPMDYETMARDVVRFIESKGLRDVALLGHSMGGKVAMSLALSPNGAQHLKHLIVADISPVRTSLLPEFMRYIGAMEHVNALPMGVVKTKSDGDLQLQKYESDLAIRQFLLTNMHVPTHTHSLTPTKQPDKAYFTLPLSTLRDAIPNLGSFPYDWKAEGRPRWEGKTLVVKGSQSPYIPDENIPAIKAFFPKMQFAELDTGHWVHAEKPNEFKKLVVDFLEQGL